MESIQQFGRNSNPEDLRRVRYDTRGTGRTKIWCENILLLSIWVLASKDLETFCSLFSFMDWWKHKWSLTLIQYWLPSAVQLGLKKKKFPFRCLFHVACLHCGPAGRHSGSVDDFSRLSQEWGCRNGKGAAEHQEPSYNVWPQKKQNGKAELKSSPHRFLWVSAPVCFFHLCPQTFPSS